LFFHLLPLFFLCFSESSLSFCCSPLSMFNSCNTSTTARVPKQYAAVTAQCRCSIYRRKQVKTLVDNNAQRKDLIMKILFNILCIFVVSLASRFCIFPLFLHLLPLFFLCFSESPSPILLFFSLYVKILQHEHECTCPNTVRGCYCPVPLFDLSQKTSKNTRGQQCTKKGLDNEKTQYLLVVKRVYITCRLWSHERYFVIRART
jgi:hypothetical protein